MKPALVLLAIASTLAGCGGTTASCTVCDQSFTDAECQELAEINDCEEGVSVQDTVCSPATQGCAFSGCGTGPIDCGWDSDAG